MASPSSWFQEQVLDWWFRGQAVTVPGSLYLALHLADPGPDGSGAEVSGGAYARVAIPSNTTNWSAPTALGDDTAITTLLDAMFPAPDGADWGLITHWGIWTAATLGELVIYGELPVARSVLDQDIAPIVPAGLLTVTAGPAEVV